MSHPVSLTANVSFFSLDAVRMWDNARTSVDQQGLDDLARSIQDSGGALHLPVGYRVEASPIECELVAGERRWRAYRLLRDRGLSDYAQIPVRLIERPRERDAYKWSLVENVQREDLKPSELGEWLARMLELVDEESGRAIWTLESLGEEIGKSKGYVSLLLTGRRAPDAVQRALDDGRCPINVAALIGGLPASMREGAAAEMVTGPMGCMSEAAAKDWINDRYRRDLRQADFDRDASGLAGAPACTACEWWGGNRDDVAGKNAVHVCLNPVCFRLKQISVAESAIGTAAEVMDEADASGLWEAHTGRLAPDSGYVDMGERPSPLVLTDAGRSGGAIVPTWGDLLKGAGLERVVVALDPHGARRTLVETGEALRVAGQSKWGGLFKEGAISEYLSPDERSAERQAKAAGDREFRATVTEGLCELVRGARTNFEASHDEILQHTARAAVSELCKGDDLAMLAEVLGVAGKDGLIGDAIDAHLGALSGRPLSAALVAILLVRRVRYEGFAPLVQEDGAPLAEICRLAHFDAGSWTRTARRKRAAAEMAGRDSAMEKAKGKAAEAIKRRTGRGE